ncbi:MAG: type 1 glutamine amidotransferase domain-containing protein [Sphingobacterium sp.]
MMETLNEKKIAILTEDGFEEIELTSPKEALEEAGAEVKIISPKPGKLRAKSGDQWVGEYPVDQTLEQAQPEHFDGILIPGGVIAPDKLRTNPQALEFVQAFARAGKPIAAICHGPQVLINAGLANGKKMTAVDAIQVDLINAGAHWQDAPVVTDNGLVTSRTPKDLPAFNKKIIEEFAEGIHTR